MLNPGALKADIVRLMTNVSHSNAERAKMWAEAYFNYASQAQTAIGTPTTLAAGKTLLENSIALAYGNPRSLPPVTANNLAAAFTAFWFAPPVVFSGSFPGVVSAVGMPVQVFSQAIQAAWYASFAARSQDVAAQQMASVLDSFTRTILVLHSTVPSPTLQPVF